MNQKSIGSKTHNTALKRDRANRAAPQLSVRGIEPQMTRNEFISLMQYPPEWNEWGMLTDELMDIQMGEYYPGSEKASEHFRNGAFHYWLHKDPSKEVLIKLAKLSLLDPDKLMAEWLRNDYIGKAKNADEEVIHVINKSL